MSMHKPIVAAIGLVTILLGCAPEAPAPAPTASSQPATLPAGPVAAIWFDVGYPPPGFTGEMQRLIVGVWSDGKIVWSDDHAEGGKPYRIAQIDPARAAKLIDDLHQVGLFDEKRDTYVGPDASYTVIAANDGQHRKHLGSWHDPPSTNP